MNPELNEELLKLYAQSITCEALNDVAKFLENHSAQDRALIKERLLQKVLEEEQQVENKRKMVEALEKQNEELKKVADENVERLQALQNLRERHNELQKNSLQENSSVQMSQKQVDDLCRMKHEIAALSETVCDQDEPTGL
uniref:Uncharacterized protein n=1 Tax=Caenorhabditis japonica TaxID=281687 RepID=A0A8R1DWR2_CAEJA